MKTLALILLIGLSLCHFSYAQKFKNIQVTVEGPSIVIRYELEGFEYGQDYEVYLYGSRNDFKEPLNFAKGDVGQKVKGDANVKMIRWDAKTELGSYSGKLSLELRGKPFIPFLKLSTDISSMKIKKGKSYLLEWDGAENAPNLDFQLVREEEVVTTIKNVPNRKNFNWVIPKNIKPAKNYNLKIVNSNNSNDWITTETFSIKKKVPTVVLFTPLLLGGAYFLIPSDGGGTTTDEGIPDPPLPE